MSGGFAGHSPLSKCLSRAFVAVSVIAFAALLWASSLCLPRALASTGTIDLEDGEYTIEMSLEGGSGRASVTSPTKLAVHDGRATVVVEWSSPNYDYMIVDGARYMPTNTTGNSAFSIPVLAFDEPFKVVADTTAMSQPHEIEYTLQVDSHSVRAVANWRTLAPIVVAFVAVAIVIVWRWKTRGGSLRG